MQTTLVHVHRDSQTEMHGVAAEEVATLATLGPLCTYAVWHVWHGRDGRRKG